MIQPTYIYRAVALPRDKQRLLDGDTYWMDIDLGVRTHAHWKIRLRNYSCVERGDPGGLAAQDFALSHLYAALQVVIQTYKDRLSHDRWVADAWIDGRSLGEILVQAAHATYTPM
jgi:endonuclease YncB( thermonuclease family)